MSIRRVDHVFDRSLDFFVRRGRAAFRRHHAGFAAKALDRMLKQYGGTLLDARRPGCLVAKLGCAGDAGAMTHLASGLVQLLTCIGRQFGGSGGR